jgi:DNA polymerase, archaea type
LRRRGATLIEADTDGVYFSVPEGWDETRERALVTEVAATLPQGLRLELEGRYQAMYTHEVKNYALLGYDGKLIVRGGALRSSRSEPFAEAWLQRALRSLLEGEVLGLRQSFLQTIQRLHERDFSLEEVVTRVKPSKTPEQYAKAKRSEAVYGALLASGRKHWTVGERVRIYRAMGGVWRLLENSSSRDYDIEHYVRLLRASYAERLRKAFKGGDFEQLFRHDEQPGLFDGPLEAIVPLRITGSSDAARQNRCGSP